MLIDPIQFAQDFASSKKQKLDKTIHFEISKPDKKQNKSRISAAMRLSKLWRASGPANSVAAIVSEVGKTLTQHADIAQEVGQVWGRTFAKTSPLPKEALDLLKKNGICWSMDFVHPPSADCFAWFLKDLKDSAPGPDGIPYSCYKALFRFSALLFSNAIGSFFRVVCLGSPLTFRGLALYLKMLRPRGPFPKLRSCAPLASKMPITKSSQAPILGSLAPSLLKWLSLFEGALSCTGS